MKDALCQRRLHFPAIDAQKMELKLVRFFYKISWKPFSWLFIKNELQAQFYSLILN